MNDPLPPVHLDKRYWAQLTDLPDRVQWVIEKLEQSLQIMRENQSETGQVLKTAQQLSHMLGEMDLEINSFELDEVTREVINALLDRTYVDEAYEEVLELDAMLDQLWENGFLDDSDPMAEEVATAISHLSDCFVSCGDRLKKTRASEDIHTIIEAIEIVISGFKELLR
ncbi:MULTISPECIES: hypothetical protein [Thermoactinomyces]|uniref:Uncharacterized protein n=1 Tax=Thermoactinomyces daqus TaxID=1329516 RepID=A0A7W1XAW0_9BACL|nr:MULTISPECIES: hypothetical protein [Thermoactinomyces]MBA4543295.1 hypothetical protein [Thermoactinomyces daqus]MBH8606819.1 hypothetical protein [Thermoactinomyces sp. CICC 10521]